MTFIECYRYSEEGYTLQPSHTVLNLQVQLNFLKRGQDDYHNPNKYAEKLVVGDSECHHSKYLHGQATLGLA